ncbi:MAG: hypothetical protein GIW98_04410 [Candidatus Eremiobacteraeota bacterium]|nr:hypothetical protein [Candidatus Eremiobacteraeota bacterium]
MKYSVRVLCCAVLLLGGCKGRGAGVPATPTPSPTAIPNAITVTVLQGGIPQTNLAVVESSDYNTTTETPIGVIQTINTDANGVASFAPGNPLSQYCFSTSVIVTGQSQPISYHNCQKPLSDYAISFGS